MYILFSLSSNIPAAFLPALKSVANSTLTPNLLAVPLIKFQSVLLNPDKDSLLLISSAVYSLFVSIPYSRSFFSPILAFSFISNSSSTSSLIQPFLRSKVSLISSSLKPASLNSFSISSFSSLSLFSTSFSIASLIDFLGPVFSSSSNFLNSSSKA